MKKKIILFTMAIAITTGLYAQKIKLNGKSFASIKEVNEYLKTDSLEIICRVQLITWGEHSRWNIGTNGIFDVYEIHEDVQILQNKPGTLSYLFAEEWTNDKDFGKAEALKKAKESFLKYKKLYTKNSPPPFVGMYLRNIKKGQYEEERIRIFFIK